MHSPDTMPNLTRLFRLDGQVALIAGGYGGIGEAIAWTLASYGATVVVSGRSLDKATLLAQSLTAAGHTAVGLSFDILSAESIRQHVDCAVACCSQVDILVNCVGAVRDARAEDLTEKDWEYLSSVNLKGAFLLAQAVGSHQLARGGGRQIHLSSLRGQLALRGAGRLAYCSTKAGLNLLVRQLAAEWAPHNILVNAVAPTFVRTEFVREYLEDESFYTTLVNRIPLGRIAEPLDCAGAVLFLASPAASFITGQILNVDGGITATQ